MKSNYKINYALTIINQLFIEMKWQKQGASLDYIY